MLARHGDHPRAGGRADAASVRAGAGGERRRGRRRARPRTGAPCSGGSRRSWRSPPRRGPRGGGGGDGERGERRRGAVSLARVGGISGGAREPRRVFGTRGNDRGRRVRRVSCPPRGDRGFESASVPFLSGGAEERRGRARRGLASETTAAAKTKKKMKKTSRTRNDAPRRTLRNQPLQTFKSIPMHREL